MPFSPDDLTAIFMYHPPDPLQQEAYARLRQASLNFAEVLVDETPPSPDQSAAIRKLRECVMTANAAIALKGKY